MAAWKSLTGETSLFLAKTWQAFSRTASILVILVGVTVILGWVLQIDLLKSVLPGSVAMKVNTALGFILAGTSLWFWHRQPALRWMRLVSQVGAIGVLLIGLLTLIEYGFSVDLSIDQLWVKTPLDPLGDAAPGRMAIHTALSFFLLGIDLALLNRRRSCALLTQIFASLIFLIASLGMLGYLFGNAIFYRIGSPTSMAVHTSVAFLLLSLGILFARPQHGVVAIFTRMDAGGILARRLIPAALIIPPLVCWLLLMSARSQIYTLELGICLLSLLIVVVFTLIIGVNAFSLSQFDQQRRQAQESLQRASQELEQRVEERTVQLRQTNEQLQIEIIDRRQAELALRDAHIQLESALAAGAVYTWRWDIAADLVIVNAAFAHLFGVDPEIATTEGLSIECFLSSIHEGDRDRISAAVQRAIETHEEYVAEYRVWTASGEQRWLTARGRVEYDAVGRPMAFPGAIADVTNRKRAEEDRDRFFQLSHDMLAIIKMDGYFFQLNPAWTKVLGYTLQELTAQPCIEFVHPDDRAKTMAEAEVVSQGNPTIEFENRYRSRDGSYRWISWNAVPFIEQKLFYCVARDVTDRKQAEVDREWLLTREQSAREEAEAANQIKDEFLAVLSHELRTPLNPILGWAKLLRGGKLDAARTNEALATIERNAKLQSQLIEDLLDISRIMQGKLTLNAAPVSLPSVISAAIETVRLAADAKTIQIETTVDPNIKTVYGDAGRLQQVIWNLLSNAVKFTPSGKQIDVRLTQVNQSAQLQVSDTGKGIKPEFLPYVFEHFRQEDGATTRKFGGLGLGLAIAHQIVELHGGRIWVESLGEDQGATFTVELPLSSSTTVVGSEAARATVSQRGPLLLANRRMLVVDDDLDSRDFVAFVMEEAGAEVTAFSSAIEALQALQMQSFDLLLSDIGMPEMDGYSLIQQIRVLPSQARLIPAIALTAYAGEADQQQALAAGFQTHLSKPIEPDQLIAIVSRVILEQTSKG